jgi:hypothetical protein
MKLRVQFLCMLAACATSAAIIDKDKALAAHTWWDNRDFDWYKANIPFFDCPDADIVTTYYYRWELVTKHLTYGSPTSGYTFTEFIDRPFWSGAYGAISCPAGHQLYEVRWLGDRRMDISSTKCAGSAIAASRRTTRATGSALKARSRAGTALGSRTRFGPCTKFRMTPRSPRTCSPIS